MAERLGICENTFRAKRHDLECSGFPPQDPITHKWDGKAIELWMDKRNGIVSNFEDNAREHAKKVIHARASALRHDQAQSQRQ